MNQRWRVACILLAVPWGLFTVAGYAAAEQGPPTHSARQVDALPPSLTSANKTAAQGLVGRFGFFHELVAGRDYTVVAEGPWHTMRQRRLRGVAQLIRFTSPQDFSGRRWPQIQYNPLNDSYQPFSAELTVKGVREVQILVDLETNVVVAVNPETFTSMSARESSDVPTSAEQGEQ